MRQAGEACSRKMAEGPGYAGGPANENDVSESRAGVGSNGANENYADTNRDGHSDDEFAKSRTAFPFRLSF